MSKNFIKLKIESIAKKLLNKNENKINNNNIKKDKNINQLNSEESTIKDSLSEFEDISKTLKNLKTRNNRNKNINYFSSKNTKQSNNTQSLQHSSLCTKFTSITENNPGPGTLDYIQKNLAEKSRKKSNELLLNNIIDNNVSNINLDALNNLVNIYNNLSELFNCNIINEKNMRNSNLNKINMNEKIISLDHEIKIL